MSAKVNSFVFSDKLIDKMKNKFNKSIKLDQEMGFTICQKKNGEIVDRYQCTGTTCRLESLRHECPKNEKLVGDFHTHPGGGEGPSLSDLSNTYGIGMGCLADMSDEINCFTRKGDYKEKIHKEIYDTYIKYQVPILENRTFSGMMKAIDESQKIVDKYFNKTKIAEDIIEADYKVQFL